MMPVVRINDATFSDLKSVAVWLGTKTPSETIDRIVRDAMDQLGLERDDEPVAEPTSTIPGAIEFKNAPGLAFTKPISASINGKPVLSPKWSTILLAMIKQIKFKGYEGEGLAQELRIPTRTKKYEEEGFKYHSDIGLSIQGQSAADAWKEIDRISSKWRIPVVIEFLWRENPKAQYPGRRGVLRSGN